MQKEIGVFQRIEDQDKVFEGAHECSFPIFVEGCGCSVSVWARPYMSIEELCRCVSSKFAIPIDSFHLTLSSHMLEDARVNRLARDVSVRVNFRLRGGMMRVPRDAPGQWSCEYCGMNRCWPTRSTCYRCGEARGHTDERRQHFRNLAREARDGGATNGVSATAASPSYAPWTNKTPLARAVPPRTATSSPPWNVQASVQRPFAEPDPHVSDKTALLRAALALFENFDLPKGVLDEIRKCVAPQRPAPKKQPEGFS